LQHIGTQFWKICFNKEPPTVPIDGQDRVDRVPEIIHTDCVAFKRAAIIAIILFTIFLFSVPAVIIGSVALANNTTCASTAARWLIIYGCIGVAEAAVLITFVSVVQRYQILLN